MEDLQKSMTDLKALMEKMDATVSALAPLVPSVSALVALPTSVDALQKTMKEAGTHLESVSVAVKRMEAGDRPSESSSAKQKGYAGSQQGSGLLNIVKFCVRCLQIAAVY